MRTSSNGIVVVVAMLSAVGAAVAQPLPPADGRRVVASTRTRASLSPDGPWLPQAITDYFDLEVQRDSGPRLEIREVALGVRMVLYVDRSTLRTVVTEDVDLVPTVAAAGQARAYNRPGMALDAGTVIEVMAPAERGLSKVQVRRRTADEAGELRVTGFVPASKIGTLYHEGRGLGASGRSEVSLPGRFQLLAAPGGAAFVVNAGRDRVPAAVVERRGAFTLVQIAEGAIGWIAASQVREVPASMREILGDMGGVAEIQECEERGDGVPSPTGGCMPDPRNTVLERTPLLDAIDGRVVGTVVSHFRHAPAQQDHGWARFDVPTRFGKAALWARLDDAALARAMRPPEKAPRRPDGTYDATTNFAELGGVVPMPPPPPPPPPAPPHRVASSTLEAQRVRGSRELPPDAATRAEMVRAKKERIVGEFQLCVDAAGAVTWVTALKSTGFPAYDAALVASMRGWAFRPVQIDGVPARVCTTMTFKFEQALPAP